MTKTGTIEISEFNDWTKQSQDRRLLFGIKEMLDALPADLALIKDVPHNSMTTASVSIISPMTSTLTLKNQDKLPNVDIGNGTASVSTISPLTLTLTPKNQESVCNLLYCRHKFNFMYLCGINMPR